MRPCGDSPTGESAAFGPTEDLAAKRAGFTSAEIVTKSGTLELLAFCQVTGDAVAGGVDRAFLYTNGVMTPIVEAESQGTAINASGQIAGQFATANGFFHAFVYTDGVTADLGTLGGSFSFANGINSCGQWIASTACGKSCSRDNALASTAPYDV